jgi:hypothetical protein
MLGRKVRTSDEEEDLLRSMDHQEEWGRDLMYVPIP